MIAWAPSQPRDCELLLLDQALNELAAIDSQQAQIVELRYFGGLTEAEVADVLTVSRSTVTREWLIAKGWLYRRITTGQERSLPDGHSLLASRQRDHRGRSRSACCGARCVCASQCAATTLRLRAEVESLLAAMEQAGNFIEQPALQSMRCRPPFQPAGFPTRPARTGAWRFSRPLHDPRVCRRRRHGRGLSGPRFQAQSRRRTQGPARGLRAGCRSLRALQARSADPRLAEPSEHRGDLRSRRLRWRSGARAGARRRTDARDQHRAGGAFRSDEALSIAKQIAEGLEAAHERGIIHRDLKPANIKLRPDGTVKILDFGLAKALDAVDVELGRFGRGGASESRQCLSTGLIFGTAAYMSPEQARGKAVDKRTDIWAFGCVLFETLTGRRAFRGETDRGHSRRRAASTSRTGACCRRTPAGVVRLLRRCLEKNADRRLHDIADARIEIENATRHHPTAVPRETARAAFWPSPRLPHRDRVGVWASYVRRATPAATDGEAAADPAARDRPLARAASMPLGHGQASIAIYSRRHAPGLCAGTPGRHHLYLAALDQLEATPIPQTEGAFGPFFSPDGRWIGFFAENKLKKVAVSGGEPIDLCDAPNPYGGSWGTDGTILFRRRRAASRADS